VIITMDAERRLAVPAVAEGFKPGDTFEEGEIVFHKIKTKRVLD